MPREGILRRLSLGGCSHQFCWPRRSPAGDYYQVCVLCGDEYSYDWESMQRLGRKPPQPATATAAPAKAARSWTPRARRIRLSGPVRYRELGAEVWSDGELKNISKSGLLFAGSCSLPEGARIEAELEMPTEICGSMGRLVRCDAQIVRIEPRDASQLCAIRIFDYAFLDRVLPVPTAEPRRLRKFISGCARRYRR